MGFIEFNPEDVNGDIVFRNDALQLGPHARSLDGTGSIIHFGLNTKHF